MGVIYSVLCPIIVLVDAFLFPHYQSQASVNLPLLTVSSFRYDFRFSRHVLSRGCCSQITADFVLFRRVRKISKRDC